MTDRPELPADVELTRTTDRFDRESIPAGLLRAHRVASGVWGRLVVEQGSVRFVFEDDPDGARTVAAGEDQVIPPDRLHHLEPVGPVVLLVEFYTSA